MQMCVNLCLVLDESIDAIYNVDVVSWHIPTHIIMLLPAIPLPMCVLK